MTRQQLWQRFQDHLCVAPSLDLSLDISRMKFDDGFFERMRAKMDEAYRAMDDLEKGGIANPDEKRMVGHYWLRAPRLAPEPALTAQIQQTLQAVKSFAAEVHAGRIRPPQAPRFSRVTAVGIGGSALGPMFVHDALREPGRDRVQFSFLDNTDPDGIARELHAIGDGLRETLTIVTSKSGGTPETRNGMILSQAAYRARGLDFAKQAVAITQQDSRLDRQAESEGWLARFPMWDWVGGRTSETSAVGLLPAALQGIDIDALLAGAAACDDVTRSHQTAKNPSALMALMWHHASGGRGAKDLVVLPYKDRLLLFSRYLQQLVMESLGKRLDLAGRRVDQGLSVYGNKGSTDQHAYVQQLRDGINNFFLTFIRVLESRTGAAVSPGGHAGASPGSTDEVEPGVTAGDYLQGFLLGTREALYENDRESMTLTVRRVDARTIGVLIALFERTVGFYASLIGVNAYHQPGVEAGKQAAAAVLDLQERLVSALDDTPRTAAELARRAGDPDAAEAAYALLEHLAADGRVQAADVADPARAAFRNSPL
jgi:glucose-6-phosphate isomerase